MRFSSLAILIALDAVIALSYAEDAPSVDAPKPAEGEQQADVQEATGMEAAV
jgi:hypothetical protein